MIYFGLDINKEGEKAKFKQIQSSLPIVFQMDKELKYANEYDAFYC